MASRDTQRVNERLRLAEEAAAQGNFQAAVNYAAAAIPYSNSQSSTQNVLNVINAYSAAGRPADTGSGAPTNPGNPNPGDGGAPPPPPRSVVGVNTVYEAGGWMVTYQIWSDGSRQEINRVRERSAGDAVEEMFNNLGLGAEFSASLKGIIDNLYQSNVMPTKQQIMNSVYTSDPYKKRFAANETIRARMANGEGRPGDRMLTPAEYIDAEKTYRTILANRDMPMGFYDSYDDFTNLIANGISAEEFQSRVDTAYDALNFADQNVVNALQQFYNLSTGDLVAYLLDPTKAVALLEGRSRNMTGAYGLNSRTELQRMYGSAQVGGIAGRQGLDAGVGMSEEIFNLNKSKQETEAAFKKAAEQEPNIERLGRLYGTAMDFKDIVREDLALEGGVESGRKRRKFASKERAAFGAEGALDAKSLRRMQDV